MGSTDEKGGELHNKIKEQNPFQRQNPFQIKL